MQKKPVLVLDLDGTVRHSKSGKFINSPEDVAIYYPAPSRIHEYVNEGYAIAALTNQAGVAHGFTTEAEVQAGIERTVKLINDAIDPDEPWFKFDAVHVAFADAEGSVSEYQYRTLGRKPYTGGLYMIEIQLFQKGIIADWDNSIFVGDRPEDRACAAAADISFVYALDWRSFHHKIGTHA